MRTPPRVRTQHLLLARLFRAVRPQSIYDSRRDHTKETPMQTQECTSCNHRNNNSDTENLLHNIKILVIFDPRNNANHFRDGADLRTSATEIPAIPEGTAPIQNTFHNGFSTGFQFNSKRAQLALHPSKIGFGMI